MRKNLLLVVGLAGVMLTACTNPFDRGGESFNEVMIGHNKAVLAELGSFEKDFVGKSSFDATMSAMNIEGSEGKMISIPKIAIKSEGKEGIGLSSADMTVLVEGNDGKDTIAVNAGLSVAQSGTVSFLKLNSLDLTLPKTQELAQAEAMVTAFKWALIGQWIKVDPKDIPGATTPTELPDPAKIRAVLETANVFVMKKDLGYSEWRYHYEVEASGGTIKPVIDQIMKALGKETMEGDLPVVITGTMEVEKANKLHAKFDGTVTGGSGSEAETLKVFANIDTGVYKVSVSGASATFDIDLKANSLNSMTGPIVVKDTKSNTEVKGTATLSKDGAKVSFDFTFNVSEAWKSKGDFSLKGSFSRTKDANVKVEIPAEFKTIQELMSAFLGGMGAGADLSGGTDTPNFPSDSTFPSETDFPENDE